MQPHVKREEASLDEQPYTPATKRRTTLKRQREDDACPENLVTALCHAIEISWLELDHGERELVRAALPLSSEADRWISTQSTIMLAGLVEHGRNAQQDRSRLGPPRRAHGTVDLGPSGTPEGKRATPENAPTRRTVDESKQQDSRQLRPTERAALKRAEKERREYERRFRW